ncbi:hypothetical protein SDC9_190114 [bioreactor metagenome]|uniref:Uncharacterized protein n=1 Tax=bioreactor metagenome TaxID=1076179 RepID=A0A645HUA6_9ZZZZ
MRYADISIHDVAGNFNIFMNRFAPVKLASSFNKTFAEKRKYDISLYIKSGVVFHHNGVDRIIKCFLESLEFYAVLRQQNIICVKPEIKIFCCLVKSMVSCCGKIINPYKVVYGFNIFARDFFCRIR